MLNTLPASRGRGRGRRSLKRNITRHDEKCQHTNNVFALQTWFLFLVAITMVQVVLLSHWVPSIITITITDDDYNTNSSGSGGESTRSSRMMMMMIDILKKEKNHGLRNTSNHESGAYNNINKHRDSNSEIDKGNNNDNNPLPDHDNEKQKTSILIVGGSDGSGTRAVVDMLMRISDVHFIMDEKGTKDVHGTQMFHGQGWPPLVKMVLDATHSADYQVKDLPIKTRQVAIQELEKLKEHLQRNVTLTRKLEQNKKKNNKDKSTTLSSSINYGFKAPVTMLLLPLLQQVFGPIKFIHVVRDGRDIALTNNKSPVIKFYNTFYTNSQQRRNKLMTMFAADNNDNNNNNHTSLSSTTSNTSNSNNSTKRRNVWSPRDVESILSMQLWNDWNTQALQWESKNQKNDKSFDFLIVRSEDFVHNETKFKSLLQLSDFVGSSQKTNQEELCCISREIVHDLGRSIPTAAKMYQQKQQQQEKIINHQKAEQHKQIQDDDTDRFGLFLNKTQQQDIHEQEMEPTKQVMTHDITLLRTGRITVGFSNKNLTNNHDNISVIDDIRHHEHHAQTSRSELLTVMRQKQNDMRMEEEEHQLEFAQLLEKREKRRQEIHQAFKELHQMRDHTKVINQRYGKWMSRLQNRPKYAALLHAEGAKGLELFGYEPPIRFFNNEQSTSARTSYSKCDESVICPLATSWK